MTAQGGAWEYTTGSKPWKVTAAERIEAGRETIVELKWREDGTRRKQSLGYGVRLANGRLDKVAVTKAVAETMAFQAALVTRATLGATPAERTAARVAALDRTPAETLTLRQGLAAITDRLTGKYPLDKPHRREVIREIKHAMRFWGESREWSSLNMDDLTALGRHRVNVLRTPKNKDGTPKNIGYRGAEVTVIRVNAVAQWLRDRGKIPPLACIAASDWREALREYWLTFTDAPSLPEPKQERHTLADLRALLKVSALVDPRFELLFRLGAMVRAGQVARCRRSHLDLTPGNETLVVPGRGGKLGGAHKLTRGQIAACKKAIGPGGYLSELEQIAPPVDYALFPGAKWRGGNDGVFPKELATATHVDRTALRNWFTKAETLAGIDHVKGRGLYGIKRAGVDAAEAFGISRKGMQQHGLWKDMQMVDKVYSDKKAERGRTEARDVRAKIFDEAI